MVLLSLFDVVDLKVEGYGHAQIEDIFFHAVTVSLQLCE